MKQEITNVSFNTWENIVVGKLNPEFSALSTKLHLSRCKRMIKLDNSLRNVRKNALEFSNIFIRHGNLPHISDDLKKVLRISR